MSQYARAIGVSGWGGGMEMAACARLHNVNVHVYESRSMLKGKHSYAPSRESTYFLLHRLNDVNLDLDMAPGGGYQRISCFDAVRPTRNTVHVLYQGSFLLILTAPLTRLFA